LISSWGLNQSHHITNAVLPSEDGGIAKRTKTARLRRKTNLWKLDRSVVIRGGMFLFLIPNRFSEISVFATQFVGV
ncbi:MAG: hypothetical protein SOV34_07600, partial [Sodaliphilus sp.]|nr:hypothetical protein [Sodaliphilus sp.]